MSNDSIGRTLIVAFLLCIFCSVLVSAAAVGLRQQQQENKAAEVKKNILNAAGLGDELAAGGSVDELFARIDVRLVDLSSGEYVEGDPSVYDARKAAKDPQAGISIPDDKDVADIKRRAKVKPVYLVRDDAGDLKRVILPIHGKGLWSTMYGFISLESDTRTVANLSFYEHAETPGLGGEIDNPRWRDGWEGKRWLNEENQPVLDVIKGQVDSNDPKSSYKVDGLSGATITANGVENTMRYWAGENGFGPYLAKLRGQS